MKQRFFVVTVLALLVGTAAPASTGGARPDTGAPPAQGSLRGRLLVASPSLKGSVFGETVILVLSHDAGGALGVILNRPLETRRLDELMRNFGVEGTAEAPDREITVHFGGPVSPGLGVVIHSADFSHRDSVRVTDFAMATSPRAYLRALSRGKGPRHAVFAVGYAGWGPGQLEGELAEGSWIVSAPDPAVIFDHAYSTMWRRALDRRLLDL